MPLDAICLSAVRGELAERITGMKIDKVQQPERDMIILTLRGGPAQCRLLISAGTGDARIHLTEYQFENPAAPPMFCMLLRKHITGARITSIEQPPAERVINLVLIAQDAMGVAAEKQLRLELIGRLSNIILASKDGIIIDCMRRIGGDLSDRRSVLPGLLYHEPPAQIGKIDPLSISRYEWQGIFDPYTEKTVDKWLLSSFSALSPLICREISWRAYGAADIKMREIKDSGAALCDEFFVLMESAKSGNYEPWSLTDEENAPRDFSYTKIMQYESVMSLKRAASFSAMLDEYYTHTAQLERVRQRASATSKTVKTARDRMIRKLAAQRDELKKTEERDNLRECGDIITANLHLMKKGQSELRADDFYSADNSIRIIPLDTLKTPQQNAAKYYKEYTKAKNAERFLEEQIQKGTRELDYLDSVLEEIGLAGGEGDLQEIRNELVQTGYLKAQKQGNKKNMQSSPMRFASSSGLPIFAGRNNMQNEQLTLNTASKTDVWLHAQKTHGAHVIISCNGKTPDEASLYEAATIASYYSSARRSGKAPVDYAYVKHVKKMPGGRPGMVIYTDYKTLIANPDEELVMSLRKS